MLHLLRDAAQLVGDRATALFDVMCSDYPHSLQRRPAQLLRAGHAEPADLAALLDAAGFVDLDDLRRQAAREHGLRLVPDELRYTRRDDDGATDRTALERMLRCEQDNLAETMRSLSASGVLELAARTILSSRHRWVFGDLKSVGYAHLFAADLASALRRVTLVDASAAAVGAAIGDAHRLDSLTVFCFRRYSRLTVRLTEHFAARGASVVAVTDGDDSPICRFATHRLRVLTRSDSATHSPTAVTAIGHALATLATAGAKGASRRARDNDQVAAALGWYEQ